MGAISTAWHKVEVDAMTMVDHNNEAQTQGENENNCVNILVYKAFDSLTVG